MPQVLHTVTAMVLKPQRMFDLLFQMVVSNNNYAITKCYLPQESTVIYTYITGCLFILVWICFPRRLIFNQRIVKEQWTAPNNGCPQLIYRSYWDGSEREGNRKGSNKEIVSCDALEYHVISIDIMWSVATTCDTVWHRLISYRVIPGDWYCRECRVVMEWMELTRPVTRGTILESDLLSVTSRHHCESLIMDAFVVYLLSTWCLCSNNLVFLRVARRKYSTVWMCQRFLFEFNQNFLISYVVGNKRGISLLDGSLSCSETADGLLICMVGAFDCVVSMNI